MKFKYSKIVCCFILCVYQLSLYARPAPVFEVLPDGRKVAVDAPHKRYSSPIPKRKVQTRKIKSREAERRKIERNISRSRGPGATKSGLVHIVRGGETLYKIGRRYKVSTYYLAYINHLKPPFRLYSGQALIIVRRRATGVEMARLNYLLRSKNINPITYITSPSSVKRRLIRQRKNVNVYKPDNHRRSFGNGQNADSEEELLTLNSKNEPYRQNNDKKSSTTSINPQKTSTITHIDWGNKKVHSNHTDNSRAKSTSHSRAKSTRQKHLIDKKQPINLAGNFNRKRALTKKSAALDATIFQHNRVVNWGWPSKGRIVKKYSKQTKGIDIAGKYGQNVLAAASGQVVYIGNSLIRYGNLVIIKHSKSYFSAYAHNQRLVVTKGQVVRSGEKIAEMGSTGTSKVKLHFEIRKNGRSVNPLRYLPGR